MTRPDLQLVAGMSVWQREKGAKRQMERETRLRRNEESERERGRERERERMGKGMRKVWGGASSMKRFGW